MEKQYELKYRKLEENYWWFRARRETIIDLMKNSPKNSKILEIGCSGGSLLNELKTRGFGSLSGIDISKMAVNFCRKRGLEGVKLADGRKTGFPENYFDIVAASDVLEHIADEQKAIFEWRRVLKKGGKLIVFVPTFQFLWSGHDEINHHRRRYSKSRLAALLKDNGFEVKRFCYWNFSLFFPISFTRILQKFIPQNNKAKDQLWNTGLVFNQILFGIMKLENKILGMGINFPVGLSAFCVAVKK